ncbi:MAG: HEPN domain-containing protein [Candidatus Nanohalobium sp.]
MPEAEELLGKSERTFEDARKALKQEMLVSTIQNRIYYSIFYAAQAALISRGEDTGSHAGVKIRLGEKLIKKGELDREWGRFFSQQQTYREQADYQVDVDIEREELEEYLEDAEEFIRKMKEVVKGQNGRGAI